MNIFGAQLASSKYLVMEEVCETLNLGLGILWSCDINRNTYRLMFVTTNTLITLRSWGLILPSARQDCSFIELTHRIRFVADTTVSTGGNPGGDDYLRKQTLKLQYNNP